MLSEELKPWMELRAWQLPAETLERLETLLELWLRYGAVMNLSGARSRGELLPHVEDGLDTAWLVRETVPVGPQTRWVDFGSGGGFPGLIVGAVLDCCLALVEPRQKRAGFLELASRAIGDRSIDVFRERFERSTWTQKSLSGFFEGTEGCARIASARAVWGPAEWLEVGGHVVGEGGHVVVHLSEAKFPLNRGAEKTVKSARGTIGVVEIATVSP